MAVATLTLTKTAVPTSVVPGGTITYTLTLTNTSVVAATGVLLTDPLPLNTTFVSFTQTSGPAFVVVPGPPSTAAAATFAAAAVAVFSLVVRANSPLAPGTVITNTAVATATAVTPVTATATVTVLATSINITKTAAPSPVSAGSPITWTIIVNNTTGVNILGATVTDTLPAGTTFVSSTPVATTVTPALVTFSGVTLLPGANVFTINGLVNSNVAAGTILTNVATATDPTTVPATVVTATASDPVVAIASLVLTKTGPARVCPCAPISYVITLTNNGPSAVTGVILTDIISSNVKLSQGLIQVAGPAFTISSLTATIATFPAGNTAIFNLNVFAPKDKACVTNFVGVNTVSGVSANSIITARAFTQVCKSKH
jgi:uncharacterized repeat protein (TIGR01451 family)